eukprot:13125624-Heterocapsa_arctica.AAC.1
MDNIFELEASAVALSATNVKKAAAILFDFAVAFPSLAHRWFFAVLMAMGVPDFVVSFVRALYTDCRSRMVFGGMEVGILRILSGIKQGCPASGSAFTLPVDPLIRAILAHDFRNAMR